MPKINPYVIEGHYPLKDVPNREWKIHRYMDSLESGLNNVNYVSKDIPPNSWRLVDYMTGEVIAPEIFKGEKSTDLKWFALEGNYPKRGLSKGRAWCKWTECATREEAWKILKSSTGRDPYDPSETFTHLRIVDQRTGEVIVDPVECRDVNANSKTEKLIKDLEKALATAKKATRAKSVTGRVKLEGDAFELCYQIYNRSHSGYHDK